ncbi:hypothetical protein OsI_25763 [Oryza sativa Indica Group]|uniref:Mediator of RNA polymerase II transcription subunit 10 n=1 Tax=Oryza sativa subsp. indica TaxID=39946 RepID=A2YKL6_ORYSI|nr:hypothetical protein OsI_25763 [Oryza sativa Indica Group]
MDGGAATNASGVAAAAAAAGNGVQAGGGGERAEDASKQNLALMMASIQRTLGLLHQLNLNVSSFSSASQLPLLQRLNSLVAELDTMQKHAEGCNIQVPMEVVNLIDDGKNPDEFTRDVLNSCIAKNQEKEKKNHQFVVTMRDGHCQTYNTAATKPSTNASKQERERKIASGESKREKDPLILCIDQPHPKSSIQLSYGEEAITNLLNDTYKKDTTR